MPILFFSTTVKMLDYKAMVPGYETPIDVDLKDHTISKIIGKYLIHLIKLKYHVGININTRILY